jgi:hypothetical protein
VNIRSPIIGEEDGKFSPAAGQQEQSLDGNWKRGYGFRPPGTKSNSMVEDSYDGKSFSTISASASMSRCA